MPSKKKIHLRLGDRSDETSENLNNGHSMFQQQLKTGRDILER